MTEHKIPTYVDYTGEIKTGVFLRTPYNYDRDAVSHETGTSCPAEEDMTQQQFKDECDINVILERFGVTGELPQNVRQPINADFIDAFDFQTAMTAITEAQTSFMEMPAKLRARFSNDPQQFIEYFQDPENRAEAEKLGLVNPRQTTTTTTTGQASAKPPEGTPSTPPTA